MVAPRNIEERAEEYAIRAIKVYRYLQKDRDGVGWVLGKQFLRSATSIGANMTEAQSGESRADFIHKCSVAQKEAKESRYWLKLMLRAELLPTKKIEPLLQETEEIVAVITAIIVKTKKNAI
jgi:four helix bundle protein